MALNQEAEQQIIWEHGENCSYRLVFDIEPDLQSVPCRICGRRIKQWDKNGLSNHRWMQAHIHNCLQLYLTQPEQYPHFELNVEQLRQIGRNINGLRSLVWDYLNPKHAELIRINKESDEIGLMINRLSVRIRKLSVLDRFPPVVDV
ncbi:hypothetical protein Ocin01_07261 [Orchesella cincta]|uniref:Uncharacterized protein n=1 Tax=Orchesella cincta TaxID=48709 RepID=A0A1D2N2D1_ORCCI|nr:hypothetical protein Ocin01_07261 [Orchesella cincta]